jgi:hypothetical protein
MRTSFVGKVSSMPRRRLGVGGDHDGAYDVHVRSLERWWLEYAVAGAQPGPEVRPS